MPPVQFKSIESFSSEDPSCPAANLLQRSNRKWRCRQAGEKSAFVVIRLESPVQINSIDIGNEHSAFIEVLVARSGPANPDFTPILPGSKFMSPVESRNSTTPNGVRFFNKSSLVPSVADKEWDLVKVVCTQPFNSHVKYGLTFVALGAADTERKKKNLVPEHFQKQIKEAAEAVRSFGRFTVREDSPDSDGPDGCSNAFAKWKQNLNQRSLHNASTSVGALMRDSATPEGMQKNVPVAGSVRNVLPSRPKPMTFDSSDEDANPRRGKDKPIVNRNSVAVLYDEADEIPDKKRIDSMARYEAKERTDVARKDAPKSGDPQKNSSNLHNVSSSKFKEFLAMTGQMPAEQDSKRNKERKSDPPVTAQPSTSRSAPAPEMRNKTFDKSPVNVRAALSMEKQALPRKRSSSPSIVTEQKSNDETHSATSKKAKTSGETMAKSDEELEKVVQYKPFAKLLEDVVLVISGIQNPDRAEIRSKALAMGAKYKPDWDSSCTHLICAYRNTPKYNQVRGKGKIIKRDWIESCYNHRKRFSWRKFAMDTDEANVTDSEDEIVDIATRKARDPVRVEPLAGKREPVMVCEIECSDEDDGHQPSSAVYDGSTEGEDDRKEEISSQSMDFFSGKTFYLDPEVGAIDVIKLEQIIRTYKGTITKSLQGLDYVVTRNSKHALPPNSRTVRLKPVWIYECNEMQCLIPVHRYVL